MGSFFWERNICDIARGTGAKIYGMDYIGQVNHTTRLCYHAIRAMSTTVTDHNYRAGRGLLTATTGMRRRNKT